MQYSPEVLSKVHSIELDILSEIIRICEKNSLVYFVDWGTLLGAVRHNGFIPWDDDIDIGMPREDYELFCKIATEQLGNGFTWQHFRENENVPSYWGKVRKDGTIFSEKAILKLPIHQGIFVDVFPYDNIPNNTKQKQKYIKTASFYNQLFVSKGITEICEERNPIRKFVYTIIRWGIHLLLMPISKQKLFKKLDTHLRKYNNTACEYICCEGISRSIQKKDDIFPLKKMKFENIEVNVPNNPHAVLEKEYGEYMILPPEKDRVGHRPYALKV